MILAAAVTELDKSRLELNNQSKLLRQKRKLFYLMIGINTIKLWL